MGNLIAVLVLRTGDEACWAMPATHLLNEVGGLSALWECPEHHPQPT